MPITYHDFEIQLTKESEDNYKAAVVDSKNNLQAEQDFSLPFNTLKMREDLKHLEELSLSSKVAKDDFHIKFGNMLYNKVFSGDFSDYFNQCLKEAFAKEQGLRIRVRIDGAKAPELNSIPWEFLHDGQDFLVTKMETPISRLPLEVSLHDTNPIEESLKMLVVVSSPLNLPDHQVLNTEREQEVILEALDKLIRDRKLEIDFVDEASLDTIQDYLSEKDYHVLHFTGHGVFDEDSEQGFLLLEDEKGQRSNVKNEDIAAILGNHKSLRLVVLSACQSAKASHNKGYPALAYTLLQRGIPSVLAMQYSVLDSSATSFAERFYSDLAVSKPVDLALTSARLALMVGENKNRVDFATPVLFLNDPNCLNIGAIKVEEEEFRLEKRPFSMGEVAWIKKGFVGRRKELRIIREGFTRDVKRVVIIHGFGGIGKTVLATRIAAKMTDYFRGVKAIRCRATLKPEDILNELNGFLNLAGINEFNQYIHDSIPLESKIDVLIQILNQVRFLIIFDNFEDCLIQPTKARLQRFHIANPDLAKFIKHLLNNVASNTKFIFTTRYDFDPLEGRLEGEIERISLAEFSFPMMMFLVNNFKELAQLEFRKRREIYTLIGGHPFALNVFSRHARVTSIENLLTEITPVSKEMIEFTLLDKSYQKINLKAKKLLKRLSVFEEAPGLEAVQWMMGNGKKPSAKVTGELQSLISWGMLAKQGEGEQEVYAMHTLVRKFAKQQLEEDKSEDRKRLLIRAAQFYEMKVKVTKNIWDYLKARDYYYQAGDYEKAYYIVYAAYDHLLRWGYLELLMKLLNESIGTLEGTIKATATGNLAQIYQRMGDYTTAIKLHEDVRDIFEKEGDRVNVAAALHNIGVIHHDQGNYPEAVRLYEKSLKIAEELQDKSGIAKTLHQLGIIHQDQGNYPEAVKLYEQSLEINKELQDKIGIASTMHTLGTIHYLQGNYPEAVKLYEQSLELNKELQNKSGIADTLHQLGNIHYLQNNYPEAVRLYEESLKIEEELKNKGGVAGSLHQLGMIHQDQGNYPEAVRLYERSLKIMEELHDKSGIASSLGQLGRIAEEQGDYRGAMEKYLIALSIFEQLKSPYAEKAKRGLACLRDKLGKKEFNRLFKEVTEKDDQKD